MANPFATGWKQLFRQMRQPTAFLQSWFTIKPGNVYNGKKVSVDVQRFGEKVAVVIKRGTGVNLNDADIVTNKEFEPPAYGEGFPTDVEDLLERSAGVDPYSDAGVSYTAKLMARLMNYFMLGMDMITRGVELQASQILQTGKLTLTGFTGDLRYELDFQPKATHFPTAPIDWSSGTSDKIADLEALAKVIRADGKVNPNVLIFGEQAMSQFLDDDAVQKRLDNRRINIGEIAPRQEMSGATFQGQVWIGAYLFEMWTYPEGYEDPQTGNYTDYIATDKVVMMSRNTRFDRTSARVPLPLGPDPRVASLLPGRITSAEADMDVTPNVYPTPNGKQIMAELESRTLLVPVQIDGFGCLDTTP